MIVGDFDAKRHMTVGSYEWRWKKSEEQTGKFIEITADERAEFLGQRENLVKALARTEKEYYEDIGKANAKLKKENPQVRVTYADYEQWLDSAKSQLERIDRILNGVEPRLKNRLDDLTLQKESYEELLKSCKTLDRIMNETRDRTELETKIKDLADQIEKEKANRHTVAPRKPFMCGTPFLKEPQSKKGGKK